MRPLNLFSFVATLGLISSVPCLGEVPPGPQIDDAIEFDLSDGTSVRPSAARPPSLSNNGRFINRPYLVITRAIDAPGNDPYPSLDMSRPELGTGHRPGLGNTRAIDAPGNDPYPSLDMSRPELGTGHRPGLGNTRAIDAPGGDPVPSLDMSREPDLGANQRPGLGNTQRSTDGAPEPEIDAADLNADGGVTVVDLIMMILEWGVCDRPDPFGTGRFCAADLTHDGYVDVEDLAFLILNWN